MDHVFVTGKKGESRFFLKKTRDFDDMGMKIGLLRGIYSTGFEKPCLIQEHLCVPLGSDEISNVVIRTRAGSGKTAAVIIAMLARLDFDSPTLQGLVLCPTREVAKQTYNLICKLSEFLKTKTHLFVGGTRILEDFRKFDDGKFHIAVGTPGRLNHIMEKSKKKSTSKNRRHGEVRMIFIDEADEMMSRGFSETLETLFRSLKHDFDIIRSDAWKKTKTLLCWTYKHSPLLKHLCDDVIRHHILPFLPKLTQHVISCSPTLPSSLTSFMDHWASPYATLKIRHDPPTLEGVWHYFVKLENETDKFVVLREIYQSFLIIRMLIFCNSTRRAVRLGQRMVEEGHDCLVLTDNQEHDEVEKGVKKMRKGEIRVIVTTDEGIKNESLRKMLENPGGPMNLNLILNYDFVRGGNGVCEKKYLWRVGRKRVRIPKKRTAISLLVKKRGDVDWMKKVEKMFEIKFRSLPNKLDL